MGARRGWRQSRRARSAAGARIEQLCEGHGYFKSWKFGDAQATRKLVERLAKQLCAVLGLEDSPFHRYRRDSGWRTKFVARPDVPDGSHEGEEEDY